MIIKNNNLDPYQKVSTGAAEISKKNATVDGNTEANFVPKNDTVNLSEEAKLRTQAHTEAINTPDVRAEKVANLKEQVGNGTYTPNSMRTAKAMISDMFADKSLYA